MKKPTTGSVEAKLIFLPNMKTMIMNLIQSRLSKIMKIEGNNLPVQDLKMYIWTEKNQYQAHYKISHLILEHVSCWNKSQTKGH